MNFGQSPTRLKESREKELEALIAPEVRAALAQNGDRTGPLSRSLNHVRPHLIDRLL